MEQKAPHCEDEGKSLPGGLGTGSGSDIAAWHSHLVKGGFSFEMEVWEWEALGSGLEIADWQFYRDAINTPLRPEPFSENGGETHGYARYRGISKVSG
jgi:hypothetical protein